MPYISYFLSIVVGDSEYLDSTEYISTTSVTPGPDLPYPVKGHCMIKIHDDLMMLTGGNLGIDKRYW